MNKSQILFIIGLLLAIIITLFAFANANPVVINFFFFDFEASQALIIFGSAALGAIIVISLGLVRHFKITRELNALRKQNEELHIQNDVLQKDFDKLSENAHQHTIETEDKPDETEVPPIEPPLV